MNVGFERIHPPPTHPKTVSPATLAGLKWESRKNVVVQFKSHLKEQLREIQLGRCCFCRRLLNDNYTVHLEHFVEKAQYKKFTFEIRNLALACGTCNGRKNGYFSSLAAKRKSRAKRSGLVFTPRCPVLARELPASSPFPSKGHAFRWVNPYVDIFSTHLEPTKGWIFRGKTRKGIRTIRGVGLNDISKIEHRALTERLKARGGTLSTLVGAIAEVNNHKAKDVAEVVVRVISRRKNSRGT